MSTDLEIGVLGAGSVGCYVGGRLAAGGAPVTFVGRERLGAEMRQHGLTLTALDALTARIPADRLRFHTEASALAECEVVLCCVKSAATAEAGRALARALRRPALVVSLQNGVRNPSVLREELPGSTVLGGIVGFNVMSKGQGTFHRATSGQLAVESSGDPRAARLVERLRASGFDVVRPASIEPVLWTKLLMNLNNSVSALSGVPTRDLVLSPGYRRILGALIGEGLRVLRAAGIRTARLGPLPVGVFPVALKLPTAIVRLVARAQLAIDAEARSSMWEDLSKGRSTEVDWLNGEIVHLARASGGRAPLNQRMVELVHEVETLAQGSPDLSADELWRRLTAGP